MRSLVNSLLIKVLKLPIPFYQQCVFFFFLLALEHSIIDSASLTVSLFADASTPASGMQLAQGYIL